MTWGRTTSSSASKTGRPSMKVESRSGRSTPTQPIRTEDVHGSQPKSMRKRSQSFSLSFFSAQRTAAKQEAIQRRADAIAALNNEVGSPGSFNNDLSSLRMFLKTRSNPSPDLGSVPSSSSTPRTSSSFKDSRKRQPHWRHEIEGDRNVDDEFSCRGLQHSSESREFRMQQHDDQLVHVTPGLARHKSAHSSSACSTVSSNVSSANMTADSGESSASGSNVEGDSSTEVTPWFNVEHTAINRAGRALNNVESQKDVDSIDMDELLDQTLIPMIMSPLGKPEGDTTSFGMRVREARSMPSLRNASKQQKSIILAAPAMPTQVAGDSNALRIQLGPALPPPRTLTQLADPATPSPLRARRQKAPLTINANIVEVSALPYLDIAPSPSATLSIVSCVTPTTSSTLNEPSPRTPLSALPTTDMSALSISLRGQSLKARRSRSNSTLKLKSSSSLLVHSPPPCPPPCTPLPDIPATFEAAAAAAATTTTSTTQQAKNRISQTAEISSTGFTTPSSSFVSARDESRRQSTISKSSVSSFRAPSGTLDASIESLAPPAVIVEARANEDPDVYVFGFAF